MADASGKSLPLDISVNGVSRLSHLAERCVLSVKATSSGPDQETVSTEVLAAAKTLEKLLRSLAPKTAAGLPTPSAPVTTLSIGSLSTNSSYSSEPSDGHRFQRIYTATVWFEATFRDFQALGETGAVLLATPHVAIHRTHWKLTDETTERLKVQLRQSVLKDAIQKAEDYAAVLGRKVVAVEVRDADSFSTYLRARQGQPSYPYPNYEQLAQKPTESVGLEPEFVELMMHIDVKFKSVD